MHEESTCLHAAPACTVVDRFWLKVAKRDGCWEWLAALTTRGYGKIAHRGRLIHAHRLSWEIHSGPIPDDLWVLHHCDNRKCVRPDHLFLGTVVDNSHDMVAKGRNKSLIKLSDQDVIRIRELCASRILTHQEIADLFHVNLSTIRKISAGTARRSVA